MSLLLGLTLHSGVSFCQTIHQQNQEISQAHTMSAVFDMDKNHSELMVCNERQICQIYSQPVIKPEPSRGSERIAISKTLIIATAIAISTIMVHGILDTNLLMLLLPFAASGLAIGAPMVALFLCHHFRLFPSMTNPLVKVVWISGSLLSQYTINEDNLMTRWFFMPLYLLVDELTGETISPLHNALQAFYYPELTNEPVSP